MMTRSEVESMMFAWAKLRVKHPIYRIRFSGFAGDEAYWLRYPGWVVLLVPRAWREYWEALPEPRIPEMSDREFDGFWLEFSRHSPAPK